MKSLIDQFLSRSDVTRRPPAPASTIDAVTTKLDTTLPAPLRHFWEQTDGVTLDRANAHMIGPNEAKRILECEGWGPYLCAEGMLPVVDDHESNYIVEAVRGPLANHLVYLPHDDGPRLLYRDFDGLINGLYGMLEIRELASLYFHSTPGDYSPNAPRPPQDQLAAQNLMASDVAKYQWKYAAQLLDETNIAEWAKLLETDHFVRRDVIARMRQMTSSPIQDLLRRDQEAFAEFAEALAETLRAAEYRVGPRRDTVLSVEGIYINLEAFFYRRKIRDAQVRFLAWITDQLEGRDPRKRPGNAFAD